MKAPRAPHKQWSEDGKRIPIRTCVVCRSRLTQSAVLRLARDASGVIHIDAARHMIGRGLYICANQQCRTPKALMRVSKTQAALLATALETWFIVPATTSRLLEVQP